MANLMMTNVSVLPLSGLVAWIFSLFIGTSLAQGPTLKIPSSLLDKKELCVTSMYEGAPRRPSGFRFPSFEKPKRGMTESTPARHVTLLIFEKDGTWDFRHINIKEFGSINNEMDFDNEFIFSHIPDGFQYCSQQPHLDLSCASIVEEGKRIICSPLFKAR
jgi:hypothetical protein